MTCRYFHFHLTELILFISSNSTTIFGTVVVKSWFSCYMFHPFLFCIFSTFSTYFFYQSSTSYYFYQLFTVTVASNARSDYNHSYILSTLSPNACPILQKVSTIIIPLCQNVDLITYRARVGTTYSRSTRLSKHLRLTLDQLVLYLIITKYKSFGIYWYVLCRIICNIGIKKLVYALLNVRLNYYSKREHKLNDLQDVNMSVLSSLVILLTIITITTSLWLFNLMYRAGDIEKNPGPILNSTSSCSTYSTHSDSLLTGSHFLTFSCLNTQSFLAKRDLIEAELSDRDILFFYIFFSSLKR